MLNTVHPEYLAKIMAHANEQRMTAAGEANQSESIRITEYWQEQLKAMPYLSRKCPLHLTDAAVTTDGEINYRRGPVIFPMFPRNPIFPIFPMNPINPIFPEKPGHPRPRHRDDGDITNLPLLFLQRKAARQYTC